MGMRGQDGSNILTRFAKAMFALSLTWTVVVFSAFSSLDLYLIDELEIEHMETLKPALIVFAGLIFCAARIRWCIRYQDGKGQFKLLAAYGVLYLVAYFIIQQMQKDDVIATTFSILNGPQFNSWELAIFHYHLSLMPWPPALLCGIPLLILLLHMISLRSQPRPGPQSSPTP